MGRYHVTALRALVISASVPVVERLLLAAHSLVQLSRTRALYSLVQALLIKEDNQLET